MKFENKIPRSDCFIGILVVENVTAESKREELDEKLNILLKQRKENPLSELEEKFREATRKLLKNGKYRATGRGKPASEYLLRESLSDSFPRLHVLVDVNNYISLKYMIPVSLWDLNLSKSNEFVFRLGQAGESYIFNSIGQELQLEDLICGCAVQDNIEKPIITPVKDSLATKLVDDTNYVAMAIYYPASVGSKEHLQGILKEASDLFINMGGKVTFQDIIFPIMK